MSVNHRHVALYIAAALTFCACGSGRRSLPLTGPVAIRTEEQQRGRRQFLEHCHMCHPSGGAGLGPSLNDKPLPAAAIRAQVRNGFGAMPSFSDKRIDDAALAAIVVYMKALRDAK